MGTEDEGHMQWHTRGFRLLSEGPKREGVLCAGEVTLYLIKTHPDGELSVTSCQGGQYLQTDPLLSTLRFIHFS